MAPKEYTPERLNEIAVDSATNMKGLIHIGHFTCEYIRDNENTSLKLSDHMICWWHIETAGYNDLCEATARCDNVAQRGIPFPDRWRTALKCPKLHDQVRECAEHVMELGNMIKRKPMNWKRFWNT